MLKATAYLCILSCTVFAFQVSLRVSILLHFRTGISLKKSFFSNSVWHSSEVYLPTMVRKMCQSCTRKHLSSIMKWPRVMSLLLGLTRIAASLDQEQRKIQSIFDILYITGLSLQPTWHRHSKPTVMVETRRSDSRNASCISWVRLGGQILQYVLIEQAISPGSDQPAFLPLAEDFHVHFVEASYQITVPIVFARVTFQSGLLCAIGLPSISLARWASSVNVRRESRTNGVAYRLPGRLLAIGRVLVSSVELIS